MKIYTFIVLFLHYTCALARSTTKKTSSVTPITNTTEKYLLESFGEHANNNGKITVSKAKEINKNKCQDDSEILNIINHYDRDNKMVDFKSLVIKKCKTLRNIEIILNRFNKCYKKMNRITTNIAVGLINKYGRNKLLYKQVKDLMVLFIENYEYNSDIDYINNFLGALIQSTRRRYESLDKIECELKIDNDGFISKDDAIKLMKAHTESYVLLNGLKRLLLTYEYKDEENEVDTIKDKNEENEADTNKDKDGENEADTNKDKDEDTNMDDES
ncbi:uncharacterized protein LOC126903834 isoform X1 [Daktulosphaira vitifoliae]|uniref:uncharacterized protein LOC126903834 isoform X1 n=1 Tax=Daktulosphaira vitifoliae TaxID=58002 RepID=UPI0021AA99B1|nr:uncharacterized protein LOC126903834 isoform X1 [Daktulosphaira vitifoliae]